MAVPDKWVGNFFKADEFACSCGCSRYEIHPKLVEVADAVRKHLGVPLSVSSGVRCPSRNSDVGGKVGSLHLPSGALHLGHAADFQFMDRGLINPLNILRLYTLFESFGRMTDSALGLGLYATFVHFDVRGERGLKASR